MIVSGTAEDKAASVGKTVLNTTPRKGPSKASRGPRRITTQSTTLQALDESLGPLGPLGEDAATTADDRPAVVQKDSPDALKPQQAKSPGRVMTDFADLEEPIRRDPRAREPPPVSPSPADGPKRTTPAHVSIEQAAKPSFHITVGDPHKVGDLTGSHTVYQVRTEVFDHAVIRAIIDNHDRPLPKLIGPPTFPSLVDTGTFFGFTTSYTITILV